MTTTKDDGQTADQECQECPEECSKGERGENDLSLRDKVLLLETSVRLLENHCMAQTEKQLRLEARMERLASMSNNVEQPKGRPGIRRTHTISGPHEGSRFRVSFREPSSRQSRDLAKNGQSNNEAGKKKRQGEEEDGNLGDSVGKAHENGEVAAAVDSLDTDHVRVRMGRAHSLGSLEQQQQQQQQQLAFPTAAAGGTSGSSNAVSESPGSSELALTPLVSEEEEEEEEDEENHLSLPSGMMVRSKSFNDVAAANAAASSSAASPGSGNFEGRRRNSHQQQQEQQQQQPQQQQQQQTKHFDFRRPFVSPFSSFRLRSSFSQSKTDILEEEGPTVTKPTASYVPLRSKSLKESGSVPHLSRLRKQQRLSWAQHWRQPQQHRWRVKRLHIVERHPSPAEGECHQRCFR